MHTGQTTVTEQKGRVARDGFLQEAGGIHQVLARSNIDRARY